MEVPLSPLEFARRARHFYGEREAMVDDEKRFIYAQFLERCDRWSAALQAMGVGQGDRVAYLFQSNSTQCPDKIFREIMIFSDSIHHIIQHFFRNRYFPRIEKYIFHSGGIHDQKSTFQLCHLHIIIPQKRFAFRL